LNLGGRAEHFEAMFGEEFEDIVTELRGVVSGDIG
jgi:hypothetical protein